MDNNAAATPEQVDEQRLASFFSNPERCRQDYLEAWQLGAQAYRVAIKLREDLAIAQQEKLRLEGQIAEARAAADRWKGYHDGLDAKLAQIRRDLA